MKYYLRASYNHAAHENGSHRAHVLYTKVNSCVTHEFRLNHSTKIQEHMRVTACECQLRHELYRTYIHTYTRTYSTAQFKLNRTRVQQGHDTTRFSFRMCASLRVHTRLMTSSLPCIAVVYVLDVCTMHMCMSEMHTPNLDYTCKQIVSQGQRNKIYKHVYVQRCNPL